MAFVPYMVGGYAVDRMMGGDGMKGALLGAGGSMLPSMLASGAGAEATAAVATDAAASSFPSLLSSVGPTAESVNPLTTGMISESISPFTQLGVESGIQGVNTGLFGQEISKQGLDSALNPKLFNGALENTFIDDGLNYLSQGKDYIDTGYEDMTMMDKVQSGMMVDSAVNKPTPQLNVAAPPIDNRSQVPTVGKPLITQIQGIQTRPPTEEELKYRAGLLR